jgi:uroporphyrinogen III methyltransferase/synthase
LIVDGLLKLGIKGSRVLIPRAREAREVLPKKLAEASADVEVVTAYETVLEDEGTSDLKHMLAAGEIDIITFTSSSTVKNFVTLFDGIDLSALLTSVTIAAIGPVTAETASKLGLRVDVVAADYTIAGLVKALIASAGASG